MACLDPERVGLGGSRIFADPTSDGEMIREKFLSIPLVLDPDFGLLFAAVSSDDTPAEGS